LLIAETTVYPQQAVLCPDLKMIVNGKDERCFCSQYTKVYLNRTRSSAATGFFFALRSLDEGGFALKKNEKEDTMWFIIIVLLIIVILNSVNGEKEMDNEENRVQYNDRVVHPAEYLMR